MNDAPKTTPSKAQTDRPGGADATTSTTKRALTRATSTSSCESFDGYVTPGDIAPVGRSRGWVRETREPDVVVAGRSGASHLVRNARRGTTTTSSSVDGRLDRSTPAFKVVKTLLKAKRYDDALKAVDSVGVDALGGASRASALRGECYEGLGRARDAGEAYVRARDLDGNPDGWFGIGRLSHAEHRFGDAIACLRAARDGYAASGAKEEVEETSRRLAAAWTDLGTAYKAQGQVEAAIETYKEVIASLPEQAAVAYYNLGVALVECGMLTEAEEAYRASIALEPTRAESYCNIGVVFKMTNRMEEAVEAYEHCLRLSPDFELGKKNLALVLTDQGTALKYKKLLSAAVATYERALSYDPTNVEAYYNLGVACAEAEEYDRAIIAYESAGRLRPECAEIWNNAGVLYKERGNDARAMDYYQRAVACNPYFAQPLNNLGVLHTMSGQAQKALEALQQAVAVEPTYAVAHNNLGVLLRDTGDINHACDAYRDCVRHSPNDRHAEQNYLLALNYVRQGEDPEVCQAHAAWGTRFVKLSGPPMKARRAVRADSGAGTSGRRKLVVGYVSPDMYTHSVSYFAAAPLSSHDKESVKCIVYNVSKYQDAQSERLRKSTLESGGEWRECAALTERELAERIRNDDVDILVELTGHTANNRLGTLALEPAPVQITWIGYPNSTGMRSIRYRITDEMCDPLDTKQTFTEQLIRIPAPYSFLCYTPNPEAPERVSLAPCLERGFVTFGCFNTLAKVTSAVRSAWATILRATPNSRFVFKSKAFACDVIRQRFLSQMAELGVDAWRIDCLPLESATKSHLSLYDGIDVALDTFPYAGTTTTCEALYMGVPVVTLAGSCHAHNVGKSLLTTVGLKECVAETVQDYVRIASSFTTEIDRLATIRAGLRNRLMNSPLCDARGFTSVLEDIYRELWQRWCDDQARTSEEDESEAEDEDNEEEEEDDDRCSGDDEGAKRSPVKDDSNSNHDTADIFDGDASGESAEGEFSSKLIDTLEI